MINIFCTKKLQEFIGVVNTDLHTATTHRSLYNWNGHLFYVNRKKCIGLVNNRTGYSVFLTDLRKKDLHNFQSLFYERLKEQLIHDEIRNAKEILDSLYSMGEIKFYKTNNDRKTIGRLNDFIGMFKRHLFYKYGNIENMHLTYENGLINNTPTGVPGETRKTWSSPVENMHKML